MQRGFSLVELSIVLVILGLLTGGILAGQSLIRAAELRAVASEFQRYSTASQTFRDKYMAIPGDMANATRFWSRQINQSWCVSNSAAAVAAPGTCDGNGNGTIAAAGAASQSGEMFQFWAQLADAGLIEGNYSGLADTGGNEATVIGTNAPASRLGNAGWSVGNAANFGGDGASYAIDYGNYFIFGALQTGVKTQSAVLKPEEAWSIDIKLVDGKPAYGRIIARFWNNACAAADDGTHANNDLAASYKLSDASVQCALNFVRQF